LTEQKLQRDGRLGNGWLDTIVLSAGVVCHLKD
jgi:hypothetical protein